MRGAPCYIAKVRRKRRWCLTVLERELKLAGDPCLHSSAVKGKNVPVYMVHSLVKDAFSCPTALAS